MMSIRPKWCEKTINGLKITEIRKGTALFEAINKLIEKQGVAPVFIYCTKDNKNCLFDFRDEEYAPDKFGCGKADTWYKQHYKLLNGKVIARFNATAEEIKWDYGSSALSKYITFDLDEWELCDKSCLTGKEMIEYLGEENKGTAVHIHDLQFFDKPKEISEFKVKHYPQYAGFVKNKTHYELVPLTRAPQSWCYCEV